MRLSSISAGSLGLLASKKAKCPWWLGHHSQDLTSSHTPGRGKHSCFPMSVSGDIPRETPFFKKGGGWAGGASTSFMEPGFSRCSIGHDFFKHTGRKHFLLNVKIYSSQSWSGKQLNTGGKKQDMSLHCVPAGEVDRMSPGSVLLRSWKK